MCVLLQINRIDTQPDTTICTNALMQQGHKI